MDPRETSRLLLELSAATLGESGGSPLESAVRAIWPGARLAAPAYPVRCGEADNLALHVAVTRAPAGSALVVEPGLERKRGFFGEVLCVACQARGLAGLVIDGGVRDVSALAARGFPVFATGIELRGASKKLAGAVGSRARVGGVDVLFGDWVVGDADGVVVVPSAALERVLAAARARAANEKRIFAELAQGRSTLELLALDASLIEGC